MVQKPMYPAQISSPGTELGVAATISAKEITLLDASKLPDAPNVATIGSDETAEVVLYTGKTGNKLTGVTRGFQGAAKSWSIGARVARYFTAYDHDALVDNVRDAAGTIPPFYNVSGNGVADDRAGLMGYITAKIADGAQRVFLPPAAVEYRISAPMRFDAIKDFVLYGVGYRSPIKADYNTDAVLIFSRCERVGVENLRIVGPGGLRQSGGDGIEFDLCTTFHARGVIIENTAAAGIYVGGGSEGTIERCRVRSTQADGIHITEGAFDIDVVRCRVFDSGDDGIATVSYKRHGAACFGIRIHENFVRDSRSRGITNVGSIGVDISQNDIENTSSCGILVHRDGTADYDTHAPIDTTVADNKIRNAGKYIAHRGSYNGIEVGESTKTKITNNTIVGSDANGVVTQANAMYVFLDGNTSEQNVEAGFKFSGSCISGGANTANNNGKQGVLMVGLDRTSDMGSFTIVDNNTSNTTNSHGGVDNFFADGCDGVRIGNILSMDNRVPYLIERAIQLHNSPNVKIACFTINVGSRLVLTGTTANIETAPFTVDAVPTAANLIGYKIGQIVYYGGESYCWDGSAWNALANKADYVRQSGYAATTGTGAAYTATLSPQPAALVDGLSITIVPHVANTVADPTLKIGALTALPIRRQSGGTFAAGSIKAGAPLSVVKVGNYFLARSAAPTGDASPATVLNGNTFMSAAYPDGETGTVPVLTGIRNATGAAQWGDGGIAVYPERGYQKGGAGDGEIKVTQSQLIQAEPDLAARNILEGVNMFGVVGTVTPRRYFAQRYNAGAYSVNEVNFGFIPRSIIISILPPGGTWRVYQTVNSGVVNQDQAKYTQFAGFVLCKSGTYNEFNVNEGLPQALRVYANSGSTYDTMIEAFG